MGLMHGAVVLQQNLDSRTFATGLAYTLTGRTEGAAECISKVQSDEGSQRGRAGEDDGEVTFEKRPHVKLKADPRGVVILGVVDLPEQDRSCNAESCYTVYTCLSVSITHA